MLHVADEAKITTPGSQTVLQQLEAEVQEVAARLRKVQYCI